MPIYNCLYALSAISAKFIERLILRQQIIRLMSYNILRVQILFITLDRVDYPLISTYIFGCCRVQFIYKITRITKCIETNVQAANMIKLL